MIKAVKLWEYRTFKDKTYYATCIPTEFIATLGSEVIYMNTIGDRVVLSKSGADSLKKEIEEFA